jgi:sigma-B regulation protein RsbU (phosphoserine phosphatase)
MRVLLIDDDPTSLMFLSAVLRRQGHEVLTATNASEGYQIILQRQASLVISDWNMPEMSGPELCRKIRSAGLLHYVYFILLSVRSDKDSLLEGLEAGADDFLVKPVDPAELRARIRGGERVLGLEQALDERNEALDKVNSELSAAYETMRKDIATAAAIQKSLLPGPLVYSDAKLDWLFIPSSLLAGDMLGYFPLDAHHLAFFQIDVSGHGVSSALISFSTSKRLTPEEGQAGLSAQRFGPDREGRANPPPHWVIGELNRRFSKEPESDSYFLTMVYGVLDVRSGRVSLSSAGHPPPLLWQRAKHAFVQTEVRGLPVGVLENSQYESEDLIMQSGDRLYIYTDGIVECPNPEGEMFGLERFQELLADATDFSLEEVKASVSETLRLWRGCDLFPDDISLLIVER